jgi:hypothetical protein
MKDMIQRLSISVAIKRIAKGIPMRQQDKIRQRIELLQNMSLFIFVPMAGIAIFSDNGIFETIAFIAGITFGVVSYLERQI